MGNNAIEIAGFIVQTVLLFIQIPTLIALIVYVIKTGEMASATRKSAEIAESTLREMRDSRDQEIAPYVVTYFDVIVDKNLIYFVIKNIGKSMAVNVKLEFDPPLPHGKISSNIERVLINGGIPSLPPSYEIRTIFDVFTEYVRSGSQLKYILTTTYYGGISPVQRKATYTQDISSYRGVTSVHEANTGDIVTQLKKIVNANTQINSALQRLAISSQDHDDESICEPTPVTEEEPETSNDQESASMKNGDKSASSEV